MSTPRAIAATASAALIAGVGAGAAVYATDLVTATDSSAASADVQADAVSTQPHDERTTVYRSPSDDDDDDGDDGDGGHESGSLRPAPSDTRWNSDSSGQTTSNTSKSS